VFFAVCEATIVQLLLWMPELAAEKDNAPRIVAGVTSYQLEWTKGMECVSSGAMGCEYLLAEHSTCVSMKAQGATDPRRETRC
jgi:hypothetical protein